MCLGWIMLVYNHKKYYKEQEEKILDDIRIKRARMLPLYNANYRNRFNENNK